MKPYEYRYQVRVYQVRTCGHCGHSYREYAEDPVWDEPLERCVTWSEPQRIASVGDQAATLYTEGQAMAPFNGFRPDGIAVGRWFDQTFHEDYYMSGDIKKPTLTPSIGAV